MCALRSISVPAAAAAAPRNIAVLSAAVTPRNWPRSRIMKRQQPIELFMPPNMLKAKVGGGLGGLDMAAMKRAESAMDGLKGQFSDWIASDVKMLIDARARYAKSSDADARGAL